MSCALGLDAIGLVMLTRGCVHLGATLLVHEFVRHIHRPLILLSGAICQLGVLTILSLWRPNDDLPLYYVITACWALSNAIWETLLLSKYSPPSTVLIIQSAGVLKNFKFITFSGWLLA